MCMYVHVYIRMCVSMYVCMCVYACMYSIKSCVYGMQRYIWLLLIMNYFVIQYLNYRKHFKKIFQQEKEVEEQRKGLMVLHPKVIRARKQV